MLDIELIFGKKKINPHKLLANGFVYEKEVYRKSFLVLKGQFRLELMIIDTRGHIDYRLMEVETNEEYVLIKVPSATGKFLAEVTLACEEVLSLVASKCFDTVMLKGEQTKRVIEHFKEVYDIEPEFLWKNSLNCAFRLHDTKKWFAVMLTIDARKLGLDKFGMIEIMDLKDSPENIERRKDDKIFFGGYHMNKKHWYTVCLNDSISDRELFRLIEDSYNLVRKKEV